MDNKSKKSKKHKSSGGDEDAAGSKKSKTSKKPSKKGHKKLRKACAAVLEPADSKKLKYSVLRQQVRAMPRTPCPACRACLLKGLERHVSTLGRS